MLTRYAPLLLLVASVAHGAPRDVPVYEVSRAEYDEIRDLSLNIIRSYPPDQFLYLAIGRSPTPVMAFLDSLLPGSTRTIPFSGFHELGRDLTADEEQHLLDHFQRFLPSRRRLGSRRLLVIDHSWTGRSLSAAVHYMKRAYGGSSLPPVPMKPLTLGAELSEEGVVGPDGTAPENVTLWEFDEVRRKIRASRYDCVARFGRFAPPFSDREACRPRPFYQAFRANIRRQMAHDPELARELRAISPRLLDHVRSHPLSRRCFVGASLAAPSIRPAQ